MKNCIHCGNEFEPEPERRRVCPVCIARRPAHLRETANTAAAVTAKAEAARYADRLLKRMEQKKAATRLFSFVSVEDKPDFEAMAAALWRQRNVIPFPHSRRSACKPPRGDFDDAA